MDFPSLLETINMLLDRISEGAKLPAKTTPDSLAAELASAVSLLLGQDPGMESEDRPVGPVESGTDGIAQMSGSLTSSIRQFPMVLKLLDQLLAAAKLPRLRPNTQPDALAGSLTQILIEDLRKQVAGKAAGVAQMGGRLARAKTAKRQLLERFETFKATGVLPERALKMARNVTSH